MASETAALLGAAQNAFNSSEAEVAAAVERQLRAVHSQTATGTGDINNTFSLGSLDLMKFRLVFVRCHFAGGFGTADMRISVDHSAGAAYDTLLATITAVGLGNDVNYRIDNDVNTDPSPWTFQIGDALRIEWTNPMSGTMTWGLEVGLAPAL